MFLTHRLRCNALLDEGTIVVCDALRESKVSRIEELDLSYNRIGLPGAESVAAYVAVTASLTEVDLRRNKFGTEGWCSIFDALAKSTTSKITKWELFSVKSLDLKEQSHWQPIWPSALR